MSRNIRTLCLLLCLAPLAHGLTVSASSYQRSEWRHWEDFDGDCQNTRQELLIMHSRVAVTFTSTRRCTVATGEWFDPYTGRVFTNASDLDIDHIIPLRYAHDAGGAMWPPLLRKLFANDPENLLIVEDNANQSKSDRGPSEYLPRHTYHCEYSRHWLFLAEKYELRLTVEDQQVLRTLQRACH